MMHHLIWCHCVLLHPFLIFIDNIGLFSQWNISWHSFNLSTSAVWTCFLHMLSILSLILIHGQFVVDTREAGLGWFVPHRGSLDADLASGQCAGFSCWAVFTLSGGLWSNNTGSSLCVSVLANRETRVSADGNTLILNKTGFSFES